MLLAPATTVPASLVWAGLGGLAVNGLLPQLVAGVLAVATPVLLSRAMHLDGLADTVDGLSASYDRDHSLEVMRRSDIGPSGVASIVLVLLVEVSCLAALLRTPSGAVLAGIALLASRLAPAVGSCRLPAARAEGLGHTVARSVTPLALAALVAVVLCLSAMAVWRAGIGWYAAVLVPLAALLGAGAVTRRAAGRLGGVTGDVIGASIEVALGSALVVATVIAGH
jgi:adenosylcobinamide-GDP ribazoletransferase